MFNLFIWYSLGSLQDYMDGSQVPETVLSSHSATDNNEIHVLVLLVLNPKSG
jgi:hypothetical protein